MPEAVPLPKTDSQTAGVKLLAVGAFSRVTVVVPEPVHPFAFVPVTVNTSPFATLDAVGV